MGIAHLNEGKNKGPIKASLGASIVLHLLILTVVVSDLTDPLGMDDDLRIKPLLVKLQEESPTQAPALAPTNNTKERGHPGTRSPATSNMEAVYGKGKASPQGDLTNIS